RECGSGFAFEVGKLLGRGNPVPSLGGPQGIREQDHLLRIAVAPADEMGRLVGLNESGHLWARLDPPEPAALGRAVWTGWASRDDPFAACEDGGNVVAQGLRRSLIGDVQLVRGQAEPVLVHEPAPRLHRIRPAAPEKQSGNFALAKAEDGITG